jgi:hypothetical protein
MARVLARAFWPGPLTLVLPRRVEAGLVPLVTAGLESVAIRVPAAPLAQALLRALGRPVAGYAHGGVGEQLSGLFPEGCVAAGDREAMAGRLAHWYRQPPSLEGVTPWPLSRTLDETLGLYRDLAGR